MPRTGIAAPKLRRRRAVVGGALAHFGQHGARHAEQGAQLVAPGIGANIVERGARRVGGVGRMHGARRQPPQQERIDGAEGEFAALRLRPRARHVVEEPGDLGGGEIGIEYQPGACGDFCFAARILERAAHVGGAPILPHDGVVDRLAGGAIPHQRGLALVGDADRRNVARRETRLADRLAAGRQHAAPKVLRIVLDPAGFRKVLRELVLRHRRNGAVMAEHHGAGGRGALVDSEDVGHGDAAG
jgi:hypothetical protein